MPESPIAPPTSVEAELAAYRRELDQVNQALQRERAGRHRAEAALHDYAQRLDHQRTAQFSILSAQSLADTLDITIAHIKSVLPCLSTTIVTYDFDHDELEILCSDHPQFVPGRRLPILMKEMIAELRQGHHYIISDIQHPDHYHRGMQSAVDIGGRTVLVVPLRYREELIGAMTVTTSEVHEFTPEELIVADEIAGSLAIAIQHRRWLRAEQEAREREVALREVALSLTTDLESDSVMRGILDQLEKIVPTTSSAIFLVDDGQIHVVASRGTRTDQQALGQFVENSPPMLQVLLETGQPRIIADTQQDSDWSILTGGEYIRSWMGIPLMVKGKPIGILTLDQDTPNSFDEEDIPRATVLAAQAAIGIENARLFRHEQESAVRLEREVRERTKQLEALYEISAAASQNLEDELLLDFSLSRALQAVAFSTGVIHLLDADQDTLYPAASQGLKPEYIAALAADSSASHALRKHLARAGGPRTLTPGESAVLPCCAEFETYTVTPLRAHGRALGTLLLMSRTAQPFTVETRNLLSAIADQIGLAVESSDLRRQARQTAVLAERERIARDLHDIVTQSLYSLVNFAEAARETAKIGEMDEVQKNVRSIMHTAHQALGEMRMLLYDLRSDVLANKGLQKALAERLATVERRAGLATQLRVEGSSHLSPTLEDVLYRVALEALNNSFRHANAQSVAVDLIATEKEAVLSVTDDGQGFRVDDVQHGPGMGLSNIRRRVREAGGTLLLQSVPEQGTRLEFRIPTKNVEAKTDRPAYARIGTEGHSQ